MFKAGRCYARKVVHGIMEEDSLQRSSAAAFARGSRRRVRHSVGLWCASND